MRKRFRKWAATLLAVTFVFSFIFDISVSALSKNINDKIQNEYITTYHVAGNHKLIFGSSWNGYYDKNLMSWNGKAYEESFFVDTPTLDIELKVVKSLFSEAGDEISSEWIGEISIGNNICFDMHNSGEFTVLYYPTTNIITIIIDEIEYLPISNFVVNKLIPIQSISVLGEQFSFGLDFYAKFWDSNQYNPELAHLMMTFANAAYDPVKVGQGYLDLGLSQYEPYNYFNYYSVYGTENVCYSIASMVDDDGSICLLAALRGSGSITDISQGTLDWLGNFDLGSAIETNFKPHNNINIAANHVYNGINTYLQEKHGKTIEDGGVKYFITGHSRGAAVANLVEYKLEPKVGKQNLYGYNFAVPDTGVVNKYTNVKGFDNIFNISNLQDPVSYLPGFTADMMFSLKQWWKTGKLDNQWKKWGISAWFGYDGEIDASTHDPVKYLESMRLRRPLGSYTETPKVNLSVSFAGWGPFIRPQYKLYATYCPVNVELVDKNGNVVASVIDGVVDYHDTHFGDVIITTVDDHKIFAVPTDKNYTLRIVGSDEGTLDYYVANVDMIQEEVSNIKCFEGVNLTDGKEMTSQVADYLDTNDTQLFLVDDENNRKQEILTSGQEVNPVFFDKNLLKLKPDKTETLTAQSIDSYHWYSTDESVVTVDNGVVTAKAIGEANIIAETENGARAICKVEVTIPVILGDVNGDENISISDVTAIQRHLAELSVLNDEQLALADTNGDGNVDIADATHLQMYLAEYGVVLGKQ